MRGGGHTAGAIAAVGSNDDIAAWQGPKTRVVDLAGRMLMPGLHDSHIHTFGIVLPDICSLESAVLTLEEMVPFLQACIERYQLPAGEWLVVDMWNFAVGNQISERLPSLRAALDAVSSEHPVILWGNDGHHGAVNSRALELARNAAGEVVGLSAATLAADFADLRFLVGVDASGEPNGEINEHARNLMGPGTQPDPAKLAALLPEIGQALAANGITSIQDAALEPVYLPYLNEFEQSGQMRFRMRIANRLEPADFTDPLTGAVDIEAMIGQLENAREMFAGSNLIDAGAVKIFADGVLEGNPYGDPPTLPNAAMLKAYRQPRFEFDPGQRQVSVRGYVDTASPLCQETREQGERFMDPAAVAAFRAEHGFHPAQCVIFDGTFADSQPFVMAYVRQAHAAGFTAHIHAIGDRAVRLAADALEQVAPPGSENPRRHAIAHLQTVNPAEQKRLGAMGIYLAWTYAWALTDPTYDMTVIPFVEDVTGEHGLYDPDSYYYQTYYPTRSMLEAGAVAVAGSDAPVDDRSPRPFVNLATGLSRRGLDGRTFNAAEALDIHQMIAAYTINGARALMQEGLVGSIEPGKRADLVVLDRNIVELYGQGRVEEIARTQVYMTLFDGEVIYQRQ